MSAVSTHNRSLLPTPVACTAQASRNSSPATNTFSPYWLLSVSASFCGTLAPRRGLEACGDPRARGGGGGGHAEIPDGAACEELEDAAGEEGAPGPPGIFQSGPQAAAPAPHVAPGFCSFPTPSGHQPVSPVPSDPALLQYSLPSVRSQPLASLPEFTSLQPVAPAAAPRALLYLCLACATRTPPPRPARLPHPGSPETWDCNRCRPSDLGRVGRGGIRGDTRSRRSQIRGLLRAWLRQGCVPDP